MKIGIFTFHCAINYGAVLQAYALQEFLDGHGHEAYIIDYRPQSLIEPYKAFPYKWDNTLAITTNITSLIRATLVFPIRIKRLWSFSRFSKEHLHLYKLDLNKENDFDAFIFGSDQIWNPLITRGLNPIYLGNFPASQGKLLIAYAASAGSTKYLKTKDLDILKKSLLHFDALSFRERSFKELCKNDLNINATTVSDPVFLVGSSAFNKLKRMPSNQKKPYLLLFLLYHIDSIRDYAEQVAKQRGLSLIEIISSGDSLRNRRIRQTVPIQDFLGYISSASFVITASFHGTALSILFKKEFCTVCLNSAVDLRASSLLKTLGLESHMVQISNPIEYTDIDYTAVENKLNKMRQESIDFLTQSLNNNPCK